MPEVDNSAGPDLVVIGASAGGIEALRQVVERLPRDLRASVVAVLHLPAGGTNVLPSILDRAGPLPARAVANGAELEPGTIYVAVPDCHVEVDDGRLRVQGGPRENGHRPAIDPLFRSAAHAHDARILGVILSGALDDGARGLRAIKANGGMTIVQDPETALHPGMPRSAIRYAAPDRVLTPPQIAAAIVEFANGAAQKGHNGGRVIEMRDRMQVEEQTSPTIRRGDRADLPGLRRRDLPGKRRRRGRVPLSRGAPVQGRRVLDRAVQDGRELALAGLRLLEERAVLMRRLADKYEPQQRTSRRFREKADELEDHATQLTHLLRDVTSRPQPVLVSEEE